MTTFLDALDTHIGLTEPHLDEYEGRTYTTPALTTDHDDGKEAGWTSAGEKRSCR